MDTITLKCAAFVTTYPFAQIGYLPRIGDTLFIAEGVYKVTLVIIPLPSTGNTDVYLEPYEGGL